MHVATAAVHGCLDATFLSVVRVVIADLMLIMAFMVVIS